MTAHVKTKVVGNMIAPPTRDVRGDPRMTGRFPTRTFHRTWSLCDGGAPPTPLVSALAAPSPSERATFHSGNWFCSPLPNTEAGAWTPAL